jgi:predicted transcriptional regulator
MMSIAEQEAIVLQIIVNNPGSNVERIDELAEHLLDVPPNTISWLVSDLVRKGSVVKVRNESRIPPLFNYYPPSRELTHHVADE